MPSSMDTPDITESQNKIYESFKNSIARLDSQNYNDNKKVFKKSIKDILSNSISYIHDICNSLLYECGWSIIYTAVHFRLNEQAAVITQIAGYSSLFFKTSTNATTFHMAAITMPEFFTDILRLLFYKDMILVYSEMNEKIDKKERTYFSELCFMIKTMAEMQDDDGCTPLHYLAYGNHIMTLAMILSYPDIDISAINKDGHTLKDLCEKYMDVSRFQYMDI